MSASIFLKGLKIHPSWDAFFAKPDVLQELQSIESELVGTNYTPQANVVLRFAEVDLKKVQTTIYGKDPYPQAGVATGRSFEVSGVKEWSDPSLNSSLRNIIKLIHKSYMKLEMGVSIETVRNDIKSGKFPILSPNKAFSKWEENGALFLNTAFTVEVGGIKEAGSHLKIWKPFFALLMAYMVKENPDIRYLLWGDAKKYAKQLSKKGVAEDNLYRAKHPCTNGDSGGYKNGSSFLECPCFNDTMESMKWVTK